MNYRFVGKPEVKLNSICAGLWRVKGGVLEYTMESIREWLNLGVIEEIPEPKRIEFDTVFASDGCNNDPDSLPDRIRKEYYGSVVAFNEIANQTFRVTVEGPL